jgi:hypothetical protein
LAKPTIEDSGTMPPTPCLWSGNMGILKGEGGKGTLAASRMGVMIDGTDHKKQTFPCSRKAEGWLLEVGGV